MYLCLKTTVRINIFMIYSVTSRQLQEKRFQQLSINRQRRQVSGCVVKLMALFLLVRPPPTTGRTVYPTVYHHFFVQI
ncbi:hypothetical protein HOLleu_30423 [Holothuria leucospilota]|uniref:Uncharacterized protein n=1 Tax=Holothuria leucospilota TaxID=206669 RepID=A0A9Q1BKE5_HOLLE|nr:hypothetical protein HOLleu_30423 [Holothuria leucospilota]